MHDRRAVLAYLGTAALSGCGARGRFAIAPRGGGAGVQPLLVATTRRGDPAPLAYGSDRAEGLDVARLDVSVPRAHAPGEIEWPPGSDPDPARHFALVGAEILPDLAALIRAARRGAGRGPGGDAVLFVHGYNNTFAEGVYRHAQIAWDYGMTGPQIHFAWASAGDPLDYSHDRDSVLIARDALARVIRGLLRDGPPRTTVVGHSMGGLLVMEALRQISLEGDGALLAGLAGVTLISPDIDIDLFASQARMLSPLPQPFVVAVSGNDRLLRLSSWLAGGRPRLGTVSDLSRLGDLGIVVVDMTGIDARGANHFLAASSPTAIALIRGLRDARPPPPPGPVLGPVRIALGGLGLSPPDG
jgi:esterase/lipase superfamily enzyme